MSDELADAARNMLRSASTPVRLGPKHHQVDYVLVPATALASLEAALTPDQQKPSSYVSVAPNMKGGTPVIHGRDLEAEFVAERYWELVDQTDAELLEALNLTRADVVVCCWYVAEYGTRKWRQRWHNWLKSSWVRTANGHGWWSLGYADVPLPPTRLQAKQETR